MIRICLGSYGQRLATLQSTYRTGVLTGCWGERLLRRSLQGRNQSWTLRIFGCLVYCHVPSEKRTKLEATAEKGIFVGYSETSKAYRVYILALRKTVVRRDVKFEEDRALRKAHDTVQQQQGIRSLRLRRMRRHRLQGTGTDAQTSDQDEEQEAPLVQDTPSSSRRRKTRWVEQTLREAQEYVGAPRTSVRESRAPQEIFQLHGSDERVVRGRAFQLSGGITTTGVARCHGGRICFHHEE
jgi:hypothetical protein